MNCNRGREKGSVRKKWIMSLRPVITKREVNLCMFKNLQLVFRIILLCFVLLLTGVPVWGGSLNARDIAINLYQDTSKTFLLNAEDSGGLTLTYTKASNPAHGTVNISGSHAMYIPNAGYTGTDFFTYTANNGSTTSNIATVWITVGGSSSLLPPDVRWLKDFKVSESFTYMPWWPAYYSLDPNGSSVKTDLNGDFFMAYGDNYSLRFAKFSKSTSQWTDNLVSTRSKAVQLPSLTRTSAGLFILSNDYNITRNYLGLSDSSLHSLPNTEGANWTKLQDFYSNRGTGDVGAAHIADYMFADPQGNLHIKLINSGWFSYGFAEYDRIYNVANNTLGPEVVISNRTSTNPDMNRNFAMGRWTPFLNDAQELSIPFEDLQTYKVFEAKSSTPYGSWTQTADILSLASGSRAQAAFQDSAGHSHALFINSGSLLYSYDWGTPVTIVSSGYNVSNADVVVSSGKIYVLFNDYNASTHVVGKSMYLMIKKDGVWSQPVNILHESSSTNFFGETCYSWEQMGFAKPFDFRQEATDLYIYYAACDGTKSGNNYLNRSIRVLKVDTDVFDITPNLAVTFPNGSNILTKGQDYSITWNSTNITGDIQIDLYKDTTNVLQLAASATDTGSYPFNPHANLADGSDYKICISAMGGSVSDCSDANFTISALSGPELSLSINNICENNYCNQSIGFGWTGIANAVSYELLVDNDPAFTSPEIFQTELTDTTYTVTNYLYDGSYFSKIRAKLSNGGYTAWSFGNEFEVSMPLFSIEPVWVPLYRLYSSSRKDHYYTTIPQHRDDYVTINQYKYERIEGYISDRKFDDPNCLPLFHLWDRVNDIHFYTADGAEKDAKITAGFSYEGILGFVFSQPFEWSTPLYRLYKSGNTDYFYTISEFERNNAKNVYGFTEEGIIGHVSPIGLINPNSRLKFSASDGFGANAGNGNFSWSHGDLSIPGIDIPFNFSRSYNSLNRGVDGPFGYGWTHSYDARLLDDGNRVYVFWPDGHADYYERNGSNMSFSSPAKCANVGCYDTLYIEKPDSDTLFTVTKKDQTKYIFKIPETNPANPDAPYDTAQLRSILDRHGHSLGLTFDLSNGNLLNIRDTVNRLISFTYYTSAEGHAGHIKTIVDPAGRTVQFFYDADDNLVSVVDPRGNSTVFAYDPSHQLISITLPEGQVLTNSYENFRVKEQTVAGKAFSFNYTDTLNTVTNPDLKDTKYAVSANQVQSITDPLNYGIPLQFGDLENPSMPTELMDKNGNVSSMTYESGSSDTDVKVQQRGNTKSVTNALNQTTTFVYDTINNLVSATDARGSVTVYEYDANKRNLVKITYPEGGIVTMTYTPSEQLETVTDPNGRVTTYSYDASGNVTRITDPLLNHIDYTYDSIGRRLSATDQLGRTTQYFYDENSNLIKMRNADNKDALFDYDGNNNLFQVTDFKGQTTTYVYNESNQLASETGPDMKTYQFTYDNLGRPATVTDPDNNVTTYLYDDGGRMTFIKYNNQTKVSFTEYDGNGNLKKMTDSNGLTQFSYDELNRMTTYADTFGNTVGYSYNDLLGNRQITYPGNKAVTYEYDRNNRLTKVTDWLNGITQYAYDNANLLQNVLNPNATKTDYSYDTANRLTGLYNKKEDNSVFAGYSFTLNTVGSPTQVDLDQPLMPADNPQYVSYSYDSANKITSAGAMTFTHDNKGNFQSTSTGNSYTFDYRNQLTDASIGGNTYSYVYDSFGNRISRTMNSVQTKYLLDLNADMTNVLADMDASGAIQNYYIYGQGLLSKITAGGQRYTYHYDQIGNTVAVTDQAGNIVEQYGYDEFGKATAGGSYTNPFRYVGKYGVMDEGNGLLFMRARYYDADNGRFISKDPIGFEGGDLNLYAYVGGNPVVGIDPEGTDRMDKLFDAIKVIHKVAQAAIKKDAMKIYFKWFGKSSSSTVDIAGDALTTLNVILNSLKEIKPVDESWSDYWKKLTTGDLNRLTTDDWLDAVAHGTASMTAVAWNSSTGLFNAVIKLSSGGEFNISLKGDQVYNFSKKYAP